MRTGYAIAAERMEEVKIRTARVYDRLTAHCNARAVPAPDTTGFFGADGVAYPHGAMRAAVAGRLARETAQWRALVIADAEATTGAHPEEVGI